MVLAYGLHDRETFVDAFQKVFGDHFSDPAKAEQLGELVISQMEALKSELEMTRILDLLSKEKTRSDSDLLVAVEKLTRQIAELQQTIETKGL